MSSIGRHISILLQRKNDIVSRISRSNNHGSTKTNDMSMEAFRDEERSEKGGEEKKMSEFERGKK